MKYILIFLLCFAYQGISQNKINKVTYNRVVNLEAIKENLKSDFSESSLKKIVEDADNYKHLSYSLLFDANQSYFSLNDIKITLDSDNEQNELNKIIKRAKHQKYYVNLKENKTLYAMTMGGEKLLVVDSTKQLNWKLTKDYKKIGDYTCFKAQLLNGSEVLAYKDGMAIEAWYTPQIPVPFGPLQFEGLPGLILEVNVGNNTYFASEIKFDVDHKIEQPTEGKEVQRKTFFSEIKANLEARIKRAKQSRQ